MDELLAWAEDHPLFTVNEAERATGMRRASLREKLSRMARRGELRRIERGQYTVQEDPMSYATYVELPSYLSLVRPPVSRPDDSATDEGRRLPAKTSDNRLQPPTDA